MSSPTYFEKPKAFRAWLEKNAATAKELLVGFRKVGSGSPSMTWPESVDEALCFGWIDGIRKRLDDQAYTIRFTPRKPTSIWSAVNIAKMEKLRAEGRMTPAGEQAFALRKEHRSATYSHEQAVTAELTPQEQRTFQKQPAARKFFEATPPSYKKALLHWITTAKKPQTRAARLTKLIEACSAHKRLRQDHAPPFPPISPIA